LYYFYGLSDPDRRNFVGSELPEYFILNQLLPLIKWPVSLAWATFEPSQGSWAYWFIKVDANLHQFTLPEGGCTEIKLMKKAPSSGILRQIC
jgi:hypothetical protein